jgi:hypothetical protein
MEFEYSKIKIETSPLKIIFIDNKGNELFFVKQKRNLESGDSVIVNIEGKVNVQTYLLPESEEFRNDR